MMTTDGPAISRLGRLRPWRHRLPQAITPHSAAMIHGVTMPTQAQSEYRPSGMLGRHSSGAAPSASSSLSMRRQRVPRVITSRT